MIWYANIAVFVLLAVKCESITIEGNCPDLGSKLPTNWLAMQGTWYEVQRSSKVSTFQADTTCESLNIKNSFRKIRLNHSFKNNQKQSKSFESSFRMTSDPIMEVQFQPGVTKELTLMGQDYSASAIFYLCEAQTNSDTSPKSEIYFWAYCRDKTLTDECKADIATVFRVRKAQEYLPYMQDTDQSC